MLNIVSPRPQLHSLLELSIICSYLFSRLYLKNQDIMQESCFVLLFSPFDTTRLVVQESDVFFECHILYNMTLES